MSKEQRHDEGWIGGGKREARKTGQLHIHA